MKKLTILLITLIVFAFGVSAQSYTQKWNNLYNRTEFFDSNGRMIGYAKYNDLYNRMEYFDANDNLQKTEQRNNLGRIQKTATATYSPLVRTTTYMTEKK